MDWAKKIERLLNGRPYADVERAAGIGPTLSVAISRKSDLSVSKAIKIAKALNVPSDWLFDDEQDWPPPEAFPVGSSAAVARIVLPIVFEAFEKGVQQLLAESQSDPGRDEKAGNRKRR